MDLYQQIKCKNAHLLYRNYGDAIQYEIFYHVLKTDHFYSKCTYHELFSRFILRDKWKGCGK